MMDDMLKRHAVVVCKYLGLWPVSDDSHEFKVAYDAICETRHIHDAVDIVKKVLRLEKT